MDGLSSVLEACRVEGAMSGHFALSAPWALRSDGVPGALFRIASGAPYWIQVEDEAPVLIGSRDVVLMPHGGKHTISSDPGLEAMPFSRFMAEQGITKPLDTPFVLKVNGDGPVTEIFSGVVRVREHRRNPVIRILPKLIHIREEEFSAVTGLAPMAEAFVSETMSCEAGWRISAARISDLLFVNILRAFLKRRNETGSNWLRGLSDPKIGHAIMLMHGEPRTGWTVESLAKAIGMSRSRFSARFGDLVGESPMAYLASHRMSLATELLIRDHRRMAEIAEQLGYESDKVFARAFRRWSGMSPSQYAKRRRESDAAQLD